MSVEAYENLDLESLKQFPIQLTVTVDRNTQGKKVNKVESVTRKVAKKAKAKVEEELSDPFANNEELPEIAPARVKRVSTFTPEE
jgi:hypothetical protein